MRHRKKNPHLGRKRGHRKYMLANMGSSLIEHKSINTTLAKAKALKLFIEPLITKSKTDTTHSRRIVFSHLKQKDAITELFGDVASKVSTRNGGYTRILRTGNRLGDNAEMCFIELVDYNETYVTDKPKKKTKSTRRSGSSKKASSSPVVDDAIIVEETKSDETKNEDLVAKTNDEPASEEKVESIENKSKAKEEEIKEDKSEAKQEEIKEDKSETKEEEIKEENNANDNETKSE